MERMNENNKLIVTGKIVSDFTYSHKVFDEKFYESFISVGRLSGNEDVLPVIISERLVDVNHDATGEIIKIDGQFRSYNRKEGGNNRLILCIFARAVQVLKNHPILIPTNEIYLDGYICKTPIYRKTPLGREIGDMLVAVNRPYSKSDYIPCISWGRNARYALSFEVGAQVRVWGRIQSREYTKKLSEIECEKRTDYEVSVGRLEYKGDKYDSDLLK